MSEIIYGAVDLSRYLNPYNYKGLERIIMTRYGLFVKGKLVYVYQSEAYARHKAELHNDKYKTQCVVKVV